jgi:hypothetical protein
MEIDHFIDKLREFFEGSESYEGITFSGPSYYVMRNEIFLKALGHYIETGENVLDEYSRIMTICWSYNLYPEHKGYDGELYNEKEIAIIMKLLAGESYWNAYEILETDQLRDLMKKLKKSIKHQQEKEAEKKERIIKKKRRAEASKFTQDPDIRYKIFQRDGEFCRQCDSTDDLTLDHIRPVSKGGADQYGA